MLQGLNFIIMMLIRLTFLAFSVQEKLPRSHFQSVYSPELFTILMISIIIAIDRIYWSATSSDAKFPFCHVTANGNIHFTNACRQCVYRYTNRFRSKYWERVILFLKAWQGSQGSSKWDNCGIQSTSLVRRFTVCSAIKAINISLLATW